MNVARNPAQDFLEASSVFLLQVKGPKIIVEGDGDKRIFNKFKRDHQVLVFNPEDSMSAMLEPDKSPRPENALANKNKKDLVIKIIERINDIVANPGKHENIEVPEGDAKMVVGVIDSDFQHVLREGEPASRPPNLFVTDKHDINAQVFDSRAFFKFCESENVAHAEGIKEICVSHAFTIGVFLYVLEIMGKKNGRYYMLKEKVLKNIEQFMELHVNPRQFVLNVEKVKQTIKNFRNLTKAEKDAFLESYSEFYAKLERENTDAYQFTNGHHLVGVLANHLSYMDGCGYKFFPHGFKNTLTARTFLRNLREMRRKFGESFSRLSSAFTHKAWDALMAVLGQPSICDLPPSTILELRDAFIDGSPVDDMIDDPARHHLLKQDAGILKNIKDAVHDLIRSRREFVSYIEGDMAKHYEYGDFKATTLFQDITRFEATTGTNLLYHYA
nr:DUF4435 domain-containing protein [Candidatus Sigynarchaeota archaeon]